MEHDDDHSSFPPEWTLPELPKPTGPPLLSTEFEEIFGGSDGTGPLIGLADEEEEDRPGVGGGGTEEGLVGGIGDSSSRDGELIMSSIEESLELKPPPGGLESIEESEVSLVDIKKEKEEEEKAKTSSPSDENKDFEKDLSLLKEEVNQEESKPLDTATDDKPDEPVKPEELQVEDNDENKTEEGESKETEEDDTSIRRSKRLRAKTEEQQDLMTAEKRLKTTAETESPPTKEIMSKDVEVKEEKVEMSVDVVGDERVEEEEEEEKEEEEEEEFDEDDDADSDDPDKVWCICQQPHNDRFMICCDRCGEWYHGDCVGITVAEGKRMEKTGQDYMCINCNDTEVSAKVERAKNRSLRLTRREEVRAKQMAELVGKRQEGVKGEVVKPAGGSKAPKPVKQEKCVCGGPGCDRTAFTTNIYCSEGCIKKHIEFSLKKLQIRGLSHVMGSPGELGKGSGGVTVIDTRTKKILTGLSAPSEKLLLPWIKNHPTYKVYVPSTKVVPASKKSSSFMRRSLDDDRRDGESVGGKLSDKNVRSHAQKALKQVLQTRAQQLKPEERVSDEALNKLAADIELKLFNLHNQEVNQKYRIKCRSLLFNLKDTKNQGLFKKILFGELSTKQFVRMTPEQLASEELAEWREKTMKKELEMIREVAKEELQMSSVVRKMTYKGEVEIERDTTLPSVDVAIKNQEEVTSTTNEKETGNVVKGEPVYTPPVDALMDSLLNDTTARHGSHVFDQNCSICTGKKEETNTVTMATEDDTAPSVNMTTIKSPDSLGNDGLDHVVTSPDSVSQPYVTPPAVTSMTSLQPLWRGNVTMHAMPTFSASAYYVSGRAQGLSDIFPETLQIVGRIAHAQVWDYLDKLKCSTTKEIAILRFERIEHEEREYLEMMDYLIQKHRYGVMQCGAHVKDMYIIPLLSNESVPTQILPFDGPGLPFNRHDMFLCVIIRAKNVPVATDTPRKRKYSGHARSAESPDVQPHPEKKHQVEVGLGGATPPTTPTPPIKVSFYGDSKDFDKKSPIEVPKGAAAAAEAKPNAAATTGLMHSGIQSILSTLSDEKLQQLASAMSTIQPTQEGGVTSAQTPPTNSHVVDSNTTPPQGVGREDSKEATDSNPKSSGGDSKSSDNSKIDGRLESKQSLDERLLAIQANIISHLPKKQSSSYPAPVDLATPTDHTHSASSDAVQKLSESNRRSANDQGTYGHERPLYSAVRSTSGHYSYTSYHDNSDSSMQYPEDDYSRYRHRNSYDAPPTHHGSGGVGGRYDYQDNYYDHYWRERDYRGGDGGSRYDDRRYHQPPLSRRESDRGGSYSHHSRPSRWN